MERGFSPGIFISRHPEIFFVIKIFTGQITLKRAKCKRVMRNNPTRR
jgi:hypothetical protein